MKKRKDVYKLPAGDTTLQWYAKAVAEMKKRDSSDPTSWAYQGAIHGIPQNPDSSQYWKPYLPLPSRSSVKKYWENCQHQSWFFLPWHRMYLAYFEQIVAQTIRDLGGPNDWSLPFWNYSDGANPKALDIPLAFTSPANDSNNLWMPNRNNTIDQSTVTLKALKKINYTTNQNEIGYGGPETDFHHGGGTSGALESLPHNMVHVDISGAMGDPNTAGLDPIFWLHHANIDRLWQVWLNQGNRHSPTESTWTDFKFDFHDKDKNPVSISCESVEDTRTILAGYTYEGVVPELPKEEILLAAKARKMPQMPLEVVTATNEVHKLTGKKKIVTLSLNAPKNENIKRFKSTANLDSSNEGKKTMLRFENMKGKGLVPIHSVYINLPDKEGNPESYYAGALALFGLEQASTSSSHNSGSGLNEYLEITELMTDLQRLPNWSEDKMDIHIVPNRPMSKDATVSIGRISLYSE
ncbi:MAG: tyrosinase [Patiriisocius sp.]|jgi:tyrosinase